MQKLGKNQMAWIAELESGKYRQTKKYLHLKDRHRHARFCCLGVYACKVSDDSPVWADATNDTQDVYCGADKQAAYDGFTGVLSTNLYRELGLYGKTGEASYDSFCRLSKERKKAFTDWANKTIYSKFPYPAYLVQYNFNSCDLVSLNDDYDFNFKQIAYAVKTWPEVWFEKVK